MKISVGLFYPQMFSFNATIRCPHNLDITFLKALL